MKSDSPHHPKDIAEFLIEVNYRSTITPCHGVKFRDVPITVFEHFPSEEECLQTMPDTGSFFCLSKGRALPGAADFKTCGEEANLANATVEDLKCLNCHADKSEHDHGLNRLYSYSRHLKAAKYSLKDFSVAIPEDSPSASGSEGSSSLVSPRSTAKRKKEGKPYSMLFIQYRTPGNHGARQKTGTLASSTVGMSRAAADTAAECSDITEITERLVDLKLMESAVDLISTLSPVEAGDMLLACDPRLSAKVVDNIKEKNAFGRNALHLASLQGDLERVRALVRAGMDVNARADNKSRTMPLLLACYYGHAEVVECLLDTKADINGKTSGNVGCFDQCILASSAMHEKQASSQLLQPCHAQCLRILTTRGMEPPSPDSKFKEQFFKFIKAKDPERVRQLLVEACRVTAEVENPCRSSDSLEGLLAFNRDMDTADSEQSQVTFFQGQVAG